MFPLRKFGCFNLQVTEVATQVLFSDIHFQSHHPRTRVIVYCPSQTLPQQRLIKPNRLLCDNLPNSVFQLVVLLRILVFEICHHLAGKAEYLLQARDSHGRAKRMEIETPTPCDNLA